MSSQFLGYVRTFPKNPNNGRGGTVLRHGTTDISVDIETKQRLIIYVYYLHNYYPMLGRNQTENNQTLGNHLSF
jgi:hypothetical protein